MLQMRLTGLALLHFHYYILNIFMVINVDDVITGFARLLAVSLWIVKWASKYTISDQPSERK